MTASFTEAKTNEWLVRSVGALGLSTLILNPLGVLLRYAAQTVDELQYLIEGISNS